MSLYETGYTIGDRYIKVEIEYEVCGGHWEHPHPCTPAVRFWVPSDVDIEKVEVLAVEYYNPEGNLIARVLRKNIGLEALTALDAENEERILSQVDSNDDLVSDLLESSI